MKTFRGSGLSSVYSVETTKDNGFALAGYTSSYWAAKSYAWLIKIGGWTNGINTTMENRNVISSVNQTMNLTTVNSATGKVPKEKASGFDVVLATATILAVYLAGRKRERE